MAEQLDELEDNVMLKEADAMETLREFKARKKAEIPKIFSVCSE